MPRLTCVSFSSFVNIVGIEIDWQMFALFPLLNKWMSRAPFCMREHVVPIFPNRCKVGHNEFVRQQVRNQSMRENHRQFPELQNIVSIPKDNHTQLADFDVRPRVTGLQGLGSRVRGPGFRG